MSYLYDARFPTFDIDGITFALAYHDGDFGTDIVVLQKVGNEWQSWGGQPADKGIIAENVTDAKIMAHGSLHGFLTWCADEAIKRAKKRAAIPLPNPNDRVDRVRYNLKKSMRVEGGKIVVAPPPLP